jgi:hypothetical protein
MVLLHDHLPLRKITDHNSAFNQFVAYQVRCLMQAIALLVALFLGNALVDFAQVLVAPGLLLALVSLRPDLIQLFVLPTCAFEASDVVELAVLIDAGG